MKSISITINGISKQFVVDPEKVLLDLLRDDLRLTGAKQSCDRKGQCGACTVIVNGKAVHSCLKKVVDLDGAEVITVEGLGTPDNPHLIQEAFVLSGAIQCGFCTPGMIMSTKALLDQNPNPDKNAIKKALAHNLCRCTGYVKIFDAVMLAAKFLRKETTPEEVWAKLNKKKMIGESHPRPTAMIKACGVAKFGADIYPENALEIAAVHSTEFHAIIKNIDMEQAKKMPGVVGVMTAQDIKGTNRLAFIAPDQPILCEDKVRTLGDPIAIVAAETREQARAAAAAVKVTYEKLPVMHTPEESLASGAYQIHPNTPNLIYQQPQIKGDAAKALASSAAVVEGKFTTQMNHQAPLEPETCVAYMDGNELVINGRSIMIHVHGGVVQGAVGAEKVRYKEPFSGGQFGIKATVSSEGVAAAAAMYFKRPVRYIPSLTESMLISSKRHPFSMIAKLGADSKGILTAYTNEFTVNKGAYMLLGPIVPMRALHMLNSSYNIENVYALAKLAYTNDASGGAARGAGPPQVVFALESLMDMLAEKIGMDPLEFRKMNSMKPGQTRSSGVAVGQWPFPELCDAVKPYYERAKKNVKDFKSDGIIKRGVGIACDSFGIGDAGGFPGHVCVELNPDDSVTVYGAVADPGEGNDSMLTQLVAHVLDLPLDKIRLYTRDTDKTWEAGPSAGSRQTYMNGGAAVIAAEKLAKAMKEAGSKKYADLQKAGKPVRYEEIKVIPETWDFDPKTGQAKGSFESQVHNIQIAEVEVNTDTGEVKVLKMTTGVDAGTIINPQNLEGQLEGGMDQGIGYALREKYVHGETKDWTTFKFPKISNSFGVEFIFRETPRENGPVGATGVGEMTMVSTAPAITNAIYNACGVRICDLPATPEKIKNALAAKK
ncbi:MAG: molybdopterin-dependent oxidoreductase [Spirochaetes bacterium]|nr:molybdopterin-dependent oxidoreductase [Spirochaetota bacterium]